MPRDIRNKIVAITGGSRGIGRATAEQFIAAHGKAEPFGAVVDGFEPLPEAERHARARVAQVGGRRSLGSNAARSGCNAVGRSTQ